MTLDPKDHWQALFDKQYLRWYDLNGKPALVKITKVDGKVEMTLPGGAKDRKPVIQLELVQGEAETVPDDRGNPTRRMKPLVLNVTNGNAIHDIYGPKPSQWIGKEIVLEQGYRKLRGKAVPAILIRAKKPQSGTTQQTQSTLPITCNACQVTGGHSADCPEASGG